jgi:hypothetical protein
MVWEQDGRILYKGPASDTIQIDKNDCHMPMIEGDNIFWTKNSAGNNSIFYSTRNSSSGIWGTPVLIDGPGDFNHLTIGNDTYSTGDLLFEKKQGSLNSLMDFDALNVPPVLSDLQDFPNANTICPSHTGIVIYTDNLQYLYNHFVTFASDTTSNFEIWLNSPYTGGNHVRISNYGNTDTHPQLFNFFVPGTNHLFDIWESWHNAHWQLWMSYLDIVTGIAEGVASENGSLRVYPNPFREETTIDYYRDQPGPVSLTIYNSMGDNVITLKPVSDNADKVTFRWDGKNENGSKLQAGIYFCSLKTNSKQARQKVLIF